MAASAFTDAVTVLHLRADIKYNLLFISAGWGEKDRVDMT